MSNKEILERLDALEQRAGEDRWASYSVPEIQIYCVLCGGEFWQPREVSSISVTCSKCAGKPIEAVGREFGNRLEAVK